MIESIPALQLPQLPEPVDAGGVLTAAAPVFRSDCVVQGLLMKLPSMHPALLVTSLLLAACNQTSSQSPPKRPPPEVAVTEIHAGSVPVNRP